MTILQIFHGYDSFHKSVDLSYIPLSLSSDIGSGLGKVSILQKGTGTLLSTYLQISDAIC